MEKTDQTMLLKRILICLSGIIIMIAFFLPWFEIENFMTVSLVKITTLPRNAMGEGGAWGWIWVVFIVVLVDVFVTALVKVYLWLQLIVAIVCGILLGVWFGNPSMLGERVLENTNSIGVYLAIAGSISLALVALIDMIQRPAKNIKAISITCFAFIFIIMYMILSAILSVFSARPMLDEMFRNSDGALNMEKMSEFSNQILITNTISFLISFVIVFVIVYFLIYKKLKKKYQI